MSKAYGKIPIVFERWSLMLLFCAVNFFNENRQTTSEHLGKHYPNRPKSANTGWGLEVFLVDARDSLEGGRGMRSSHFNCSGVNESLAMIPLNARSHALGGIQ